MQEVRVMDEVISKEDDVVQGFLKSLLDASESFKCHVCGKKSNKRWEFTIHGSPVCRLYCNECFEKYCKKDTGEQRNYIKKSGFL